MPESLESQLRALAERLDNAVEPVRAHDVIVAEMTPTEKRAPRFSGGRAAAALAMAAALALGAVVVADHTRDGSGPTATSPATAQHRVPPVHTARSWTDQLPRCRGMQGIRVTEQQAGVHIAIDIPKSSAGSDRVPPWFATVTNESNRTIAVERHMELAVATTADGALISSGPVNSNYVTPAQVAPHGHSTLRFIVGTDACVNGGFSIPGGTYQVVLPVLVDNRLVYSKPFPVDVAPNGAARPHNGPPFGAWRSTKGMTGAQPCGQPAPQLTGGEVTGSLRPRAIGTWDLTLHNRSGARIRTTTYRKQVGPVALSPQIVGSVLVDASNRVAAVTLRSAGVQEPLGTVLHGTTWNVDVFAATRSCRELTRPPAPGSYTLYALVDLDGQTRGTAQPVTVDASGALHVARAATRAPNTGAAGMCLFAHTNLYYLREPITIALPGHKPTPIVAGNPITRPDAVTLDGDGSTDPGRVGYAQGASTLFWGADTSGGPFAQLDSVRSGVVTIAQGGVPSCMQRWRVVAVAASKGAGPSFPAQESSVRLVLVGFTPGAPGQGPGEDRYVLAVPVGLTFGAQ